MDTDIEVGSGFTLKLPDEIVRDARIRGIAMIMFPTAGVAWYPRTHSWRAYLYIEGRQKHIGYFKDRDLAIRARQRAEEERSGISS